MDKNINRNANIANDDDDVDASSINHDGGNQNNTATSRTTNYTAVEDLLVTNAFLRASEDAIAGSRQKGHIFKSKIESAYHSLKEEQEAHGKRMAQRPSHLQMVQGPGFYPAKSGKLLHIRFTKQICPRLVKFVSVVKQNPIASGEDPKSGR